MRQRRRTPRRQGRTISTQNPEQLPELFETTAKNSGSLRVIDRDRVFLGAEVSSYFTGGPDKVSDFIKNGGTLENWIDEANLQSDYAAGLEKRMKELEELSAQEATLLKNKGTVESLDNFMSPKDKNYEKIATEKISSEEKIAFNKKSNYAGPLEANTFDYQDKAAMEYSKKHQPKYGKQRPLAQKGFGKWKGATMVAGAIALGGLALNMADNRGQLSNAQLYGQRSLY